jgi:HAD superfamily hydrolase (TIGR01509 family)
VIEPFEGVIFDFHSTLVDGGDPAHWLDDARRRLADPPPLDERQVKELCDYLDHIWDHAHLIDPASERDLDPRRHHDVFTRTMGRFPGIGEELIAALYATMTDQWVAFDDAAGVLRDLRAHGVRVLVLSNVGMDIRDGLARQGLLDLVDEVLLSYEVGVVKPDRAIFARALERLGTDATRTLMVGDSAHADTGGAALGLRTLILPRTRGPVHGLEAVTRLVLG